MKTNCVCVEYGETSWTAGKTSWTAFDNDDVTAWKYAKLAESNER